jgi:hypothetical protein
MLACTGFAQSPTGTIRGTVSDRSGAVITGATITITNVQTNETRTAQSDNEGRYILNFVQPAVYTVTATAANFETVRQDNIVVEVSVGRPVDFTLGVAKVSLNVEVTSATPPLETSTSAVDTVVNAQQITDLPLNGRNPTSLEVLVPGVSTVGNASTPHIAGSRNANNEEQIDGMTNILPENNVGNNSTALTPIRFKNSMCKPVRCRRNTAGSLAVSSAWLPAPARISFTAPCLISLKRMLCMPRIISPPGLFQILICINMEGLWVAR